MANPTSATFFWFTLVLSLGLLTACGNTTQPVQPPPGPYAITIKTSPNDTVSSLEQRYQGTISAFHPELGFAVLASDKAAQGAEISALETDTNVLTPPEIRDPNAGAGTGWGGSLGDLGNPTDGGVSFGSTIQPTTRAEPGVSSSGWNAWISGWNAWISGNALPTAPIENLEVFKSIGLTQAHQLSRKFGEGITVAVIDTGVDLTHPGIKNHLSPAADWRDFVDNDNLPQDETGIVGEAANPAAAYGHGTAVAGIILQIAPKATILPLRVLTPSGGGDLTDVVKAIDYAIEKGALIINLSLGSTKNDVALSSELTYAKSKGVYVIASAGNNGLLDKADYPAALSYRRDNEVDVGGSTFGVGSISNSEALSSFTARGGVFAFAPGEKIYSFYPKNRVGYATGTSFATPLVSGAMALAASELLDSANQAKLGKILDDSLEGARIFKKFYNAQPDERWLYGSGVLDVQRLILSLPGSVIPAAISQTNLLSNPGFEAGPTDSSWVIQDAAIVQTEARTGSYSLAFLPSLKQYTTNGVGGLKPNTTYTFIGYFKTTSPDDLFCFTISGFTSDPVIEGEAVSCKKSQDYALQSIRFTTDATHTEAIVFAHIDGSPSTGSVGAAYLDDTMIIETP